MAMRQVVRVEMRQKLIESVVSRKRKDYARGGFVETEIICRTTTCTPFAVLECGHERRERNCGTKVSSAKRLFCADCEKQQAAA